MDRSVRKNIGIQIGDRTFHPSKKILAKDQLLELAGLDPKQYQVFLVDVKNKEHRIDSDEGIELKDGMKFLIRSSL
jgi:hypothetical protein